jgi:hypothetical protein
MNVCNCRRRLGPRATAVTAVALGVGLLLAPSTCRADFLLPLNFQPGGPIVSGSNGSLTYDATTHDFHATLSSSSLIYAAPFVTPSGFVLITGGTLTMDLTVDNNGAFVANGTGLKLTGSVTINGADFTGTLLTGVITAFGAQDAGPPTREFNGYITISGGALTQTKPGTGGKSVFGGFPVGQPGGFRLIAEDVTSGTLGNFVQNFSSDSVKPEVGVLVPEPSTLVLWLTGAVVLVGWRKPQLWRQVRARLPQPSALVPLLAGTLVLAGRGMVHLRPHAPLRRRMAPTHAG